MPTSAEIEAMLTGPAGAFEVATEVVNGVPTRVYKNRMASLREVAELAAGRGDEQAFIVHRGRRIGFATFLEQAHAVSRSLAGSFGVERGDRVAVLSANNPEWCLSFWGTVGMGAVLVGLNGWWKTDEILYGLRHCGAKVLVADGPRFARVMSDLDSCPDLEAVFLIDADPSDLGGADRRVRPFEELLKGSSADTDPLTTPIDEDDPAVIFYTSGTTGRPKGAVSTHRSMVANLQNTLYNALAGAMADPEGGSAFGGAQIASFLSSPLFHVSGCHSGLVVGMVSGIKLVIPDGRFDPEGAMRLMQDEQVTVWATVPTMIWRVVEHPARHDYDLSSVTTVAYGGSPSAAELQRRVEETFPNVRTMGNAYGLTESSSVATVNWGSELVNRPDSVGRALPVVEVRVVQGDGKDVTTGDIGEIWIKGPIVMPGYWNDPEATAETVTDGWLHSGDIGYLDRDGFLYVTDRAKDMIIRGGENVYCVEIENRLMEHSDVADAAVIGVPHPTLGEEVKAVVRPEPGASVTEDGLRAWVAEALADFKVPAYVELRAEVLPRNAAGKLMKDVLRGRGEVGLAETM
ncbi:MAG TPA: class I adenylate-forming enzyme family protein [Acidimicrobiales bacterium]